MSTNIWIEPLNFRQLLTQVCVPHRYSHGPKSRDSDHLQMAPPWYIDYDQTSMSDEDEFLSEESYEFEFEDDDDAEIEENPENEHDSIVCSPSPTQIIEYPLTH